MVINLVVFRKIAFLLILGFSFFPLQLFSQQSETLTISTYYPSPHGVYQSLRLFPSAEAAQPVCDVNSEGTMYYDITANQAMMCSEVSTDTYAWGPLSGLWTLAGTSPNQIIYPNDLINWKVSIGNTDPLFGGDGTMMSIVGTGNNKNLVLGIRDNPAGVARPSMAITPKNDGEWRIYDYGTAGTWTKDMSAKDGVVTVNQLVITPRASNPSGPQEGEIWVIQ